MFLLFCFALALTMDAASLRPKDDQFREQRWETEEGLPQNFVTALAQTVDGYIWVGTSDGLARFDGERFTAFTTQNAPDVGSDYIRALQATRDGSLWIGTEGAGVRRYHDGQFTAFDTAHGFLNNYVRAIIEDRSGRIWVGTAGGLACWREGQWHFYGTAEGLDRASVFALYEDTAGVLWVGQGNGGLFRFENDRLVPVAVPEMLTTRTINAIVPAPGGLAFATVGGDVVWQHNGRFESLGLDRGLASPLVNTALTDPHGDIWVGTTNGLQRFNGQRFVTARAGEADAIVSDVNALLVDREENFWIGTTRGLVRLNPGRFESLTTAHGLSHNVVLTAIEDRQGGLWIGTNNAGLNYWNHGLRGVYNLRPNSPGETVFALAELQDGSILAGKHGPTMIVRDGNATVYQPTPDFSALSAHAILQEKRGDVWLGCDNGLVHLRPDRSVQTLQLPTDTERRIRALNTDVAGRLWIGTDGGLLRLENATASPRHIGPSEGMVDASVRSIVGDADGQTLWIGTTRGLVRWRNDRFFVIGAAQGLAHESLQQIVEDALGFLWISCPGGIFRVSKVELNDLADGNRTQVTCALFGRSFGVTSSQYRGSGQPVGCRLHDGRLAFASANGVIFIDPAQVVPNTAPPPVRIDSVSMDGIPVPVIAGRAAIPAGPPRDLAIHYSALSFQEPANVRSAYRLDNVDPAWRTAGNQQIVLYHGLPPGRYHFQVRASNNDGVWNNTGAALQFEIAPRYYQTAWFKILIPVGLLALIAAMYLVRTAQLRRQRQHLVAMVDERTVHLQKEIAHRLETEQALRNSEERFSKAFGASPIPIAICTQAEGRFIDANPALLKLIGRSREEVVGHTGHELNIWQDEQERTAIFSAPAAEKKNRELTVRRPSGEQRRVILSVEQIELGQTAHFVLLLHDVTELFNLEAQVRHMQKIEAVGQLAAGIAHDFNNLLTVIQGHVSYLRVDQKDAEMNKSLEEVSRAASRAAALTRQLLTFTRRQLMQGKPLDLNEIIRRLANMLRPILGATIRIDLNLVLGLPLVFADEGMLEQVLVNLAVNSRDAMPNGGIFSVDTSLAQITPDYVAQHPSAREGKFVVLIVSDTGCGMDEATRNRVFEPFFTTKATGQGTGLGMSVVYGIIQQHQGWIELESEVGRGATFRIFLPATESKPLPPVPAPSSPSERGRERIFVVEDEPAVRHLACTILKRHGYEIIDAGSGPEALRVWSEQSGRFDLLFTDMVMPGGLSGMELAAKLREQKPDLRVIFTTGYSQDALSSAKHAPGKLIVLPKPYSGSELVALIRRTLDAGSAGRPAAGGAGPVTRASVRGP